MCFVTLGHFWHFSVFLDIMTNTLAGKDDCKRIIVRILGRHLKFYDPQCVSGLVLLFFSLSSFLRWLSFCKILHVQIAFIYVVPQPIWTTIWWAKYSGEIINTDCHFWFRKRSVLRTLGTYLTHGLIVVYIYMRLSGPKKKSKIMLSPIFQVT